MERKDFIRKTLLGASLVASIPPVAKAVEDKRTSSTYDKLKEGLSPIDQVGFNHLPNKKEIKTMNTVIHRADTRGKADHGWLKANHSFSFANYYNPERMHFGVLRVLNDDHIAGGGGFPTHPHDNMEIITIPLEGALEHKDSMGNSSVIHHGDVQVMSAGTGILHSEFNHNEGDPVKLLQIWLFPNKKNVTPRYDQISLDDTERNSLRQILSPDPEDEGVWIHQDAWFSLADMDQDKQEKYTIKKSGNGVYAFIIAGEFEIEGNTLEAKDAIGIWDTDSFTLKAKSDDSRILLMDVPMKLS